MNGDEISTELVPIKESNWARRNSALFAVILSAAAILGSIAFTYGKVIQSMASFETQLASFRTELAKVEVHIVDVDSRVRQHHENSDVHIDATKWKLLTKQLDDMDQSMQILTRRLNR